MIPKIMAIGASLLGLLLFGLWWFRPTHEKHREHAGRQLATYGGVKSGPLEERLAEVPSALEDYLVEDNFLNGFRTTPKAAVLNDREKALVAAALRDVPNEVRQAVDHYLAAVFVVDDLGSSAFTENLSGPERASIMVFDRRVLELDANSWATKKELTVFEQVPPNTFSVRLRQSKENAPGLGLRYLMLHELGHVVAYAQRLHPTAGSGDFDETAFSRLSWQPHTRSDGVRTSGKLKPELDPKFTFGFYGTTFRVPVARAQVLYELASKNCFATLYAMTSVDDDFAEAFAMYAHMKLQNGVYSVSIDGPPAVNFSTPLFEPRCAAKLSFVERSLGITR